MSKITINKLRELGLVTKFPLNREKRDTDLASGISCKKESDSILSNFLIYKNNYLYATLIGEQLLATSDGNKEIDIIYADN